MFTLRVDQERGLDLLRQSLGNGKRRPLFAMPTGGGKTVIMTAIVGGARAKGNRAMITVPQIQLIDQTVEKLIAAGIPEDDIGVIQGDHPSENPRAPVQVASVQTLQRRGRVPKVELVIIDEAHRWFNFYSEWMGDIEWRRVPFIGFSATPWTKGLGKHYDDLVIAATTQELIDAKLLSPFRVFAPSHPDLKGVKTVAGDYHEGQLAERMNPLTADIVQTWRQKAEGRPTLLFAVDRAHAESLAARFKAAGVAAEYADAYTPRIERTAMGLRLKHRRTKVVCNVGIFTTGTDWPFIGCIVLARPTKSEMLYLQMIGRGLRTSPGKADLLILDHSDTTLRLGFVTDIHHDELDDGKPKPKAKTKQKEPKLPKECPSCGQLKVGRKCPGCGFEPKPQSSEQQGELAELTPGKAKADRATKQRWFSMLRHYAQRRGFADGWVAHTFREKWSVWPRGLSDLTTEPDAEVLGYIRHKLIRHAKGRQKAAA